MRGRLLFCTIAACALAGPAIATPPPFGGSRNLHVDVDFNFITQSPNIWQSSGAFTDSGTIKHDHSEFFQGAVAVVTDSPEGANGSFTWSFHKANTSSRGEVHLTRGSWTMNGGTGDYAGISGSGTMSGWYNLSTGEIHDEFDGTVDCPNC